MLKIEIDGHFHGSSDVPKPWVAEILGPCPKYGLARKFIDPMNDWRDARKAWSGNVYGRTSNFALRDGRLYEVSRCKGSPSKRHVAREFFLVVDGKRKRLEAQEVLARIYGEAVLYRIPEDREGRSWVARVRGLGTPEQLGFVVVDDRRLYCLGAGLYEVAQGDDRRFVVVADGAVKELTEREALAWLVA